MVSIQSKDTRSESHVHHHKDMRHKNNDVTGQDTINGVSLELLFGALHALRIVKHNILISDSKRIAMLPSFYL